MSSSPSNQASKSPKEAYEWMLALTQTAINRLLSTRIHYESVRLQRNRAWTLLLIGFASARTRLETVVSPDVFVEQALERFNELLNKLTSDSSDIWVHAFQEDKVLIDAIGCLFCPPDIESNRDLLIPSIDPMGFNVPAVFDALVQNAPSVDSTKPDDFMAVLLDRNVRRLCSIHKILSSHWASALETTNWWRLCNQLEPKPQDIESAKRQAILRVQRLQQSFRDYLETFSPLLDNTHDDDFESRANVVQQHFKLDVHAYHRSFETASQRRDKVYRVIESREQVLK